MNIVILGGGASGMTAAISAALSNSKNKITIIEHSDRVGKKILATGNGKCNLTNEDMRYEYFRCEDSECVKTVIDAFGYSDTIQFFSELGIMFKIRDGYVYPASGQASSVLDVLRLKCDELGVKIITDKNINNIKDREERQEAHVSDVSAEKKDDFHRLLDENADLMQQLRKKYRKGENDAG